MLVFFEIVNIYYYLANLIQLRHGEACKDKMCANSTQC